jgi:hypothetical protein
VSHELIRVSNNQVREAVPSLNYVVLDFNG